MRCRPAELIRKCGGFALTVAIIGARLRNKPLAFWDVVLNQIRKADLDKFRQQLPGYQYPDVLGALQVSLDALEPQMRKRYFALAVRAVIEKGPASVIKVPPPEAPDLPAGWALPASGPRRAKRWFLPQW